MTINTDTLLRELIALDRETLELERSERRWGAARLLLMLGGLGLFFLL